MWRELLLLLRERERVCTRAGRRKSAGNTTATRCQMTQRIQFHFGHDMDEWELEQERERERDDFSRSIQMNINIGIEEKSIIKKNKNGRKGGSWWLKFPSAAAAIALAIGTSPTERPTTFSSSDLLGKKSTIKKMSKGDDDDDEEEEEEEN